METIAITLTITVAVTISIANICKTCIRIAESNNQAYDLSNREAAKIKEKTSQLDACMKDLEHRMARLEKGNRETKKGETQINQPPSIRDGSLHGKFHNLVVNQKMQDIIRRCYENTNRKEPMCCNFKARVATSDDNGTLFAETTLWPDRYRVDSHGIEWERKKGTMEHIETITVTEIELKL